MTQRMALTDTSKRFAEFCMRGSFPLPVIGTPCGMSGDEGDVES